MTEDKVYDVVIIGGGPAGLTAAQYASRSKLSVAVLDKSATAGALAFTSKIENYPGVVEPVSGKELLDLFRQQALNFGAEYFDEVQVVGVSVEGETKEVFTMDRSFKGRSLIIATGAMGRKPTIKGEGEYLGRGVSYCAICDANFFRGKVVAVLGDSEEAVKEAGLLCKFAATVYLLAPSDRLKVPADYPSLASANLKVILGAKAREITATDVVDGIRYENKDGKEETLPLSGVFVYIHGSKPIVDFLAGALEVSEEGCIRTNKFMETSIAGVYAAGDVTCTEVRQVILAAADGCVAALSADKYLHHRGRRKLDWSKS